MKFLGPNSFTAKNPRPGLGSMLWPAEACPEPEKAQLATGTFSGAVPALFLVEDKEAHQLRPVDYRNLGPRNSAACTSHSWSCTRR